MPVVHKGETNDGPRAETANDSSQIETEWGSEPSEERAASQSARANHQPGSDQVAMSDAAPEHKADRESIEEVTPGHKTDSVSVLVSCNSSALKAAHIPNFSFGQFGPFFQFWSVRSVRSMEAGS